MLNLEDIYRLGETSKSFCLSQDDSCDALYRHISGTETHHDFAQPLPRAQHTLACDAQASACTTQACERHCLPPVSLTLCHSVPLLLCSAPQRVGADGTQTRESLKLTALSRTL